MPIGLFSRRKGGYSCFFIAPMEQPDSEERNNADFVLNVLLRPVLAQCGFPEERIVRASPGISDEITRRLTDDDLCIADLTDLSPNVMYALGYRRGLGKPVLAIAKAGQRLPFDVHDFQAVSYDLYSDAAMRKLPSTQSELKGRIMEWVDKGFARSNGGVNASDIYERLSQIEKKLDRALSSASASVASPAPNNPDINRMIRQIGSTFGTLNYAIQNKDVGLAEALLPRLASELSKAEYIDKAVSQVAAMGSEKAATILKAEWDYVSRNLPLQQRCEELAAYVSYCNKRDLEPVEIDFVIAEAEKLLADAHISDKLKADVYNQINRMWYGLYITTQSQDEEPNVQYLENAIQALENATRLNPAEESYFYNLALCYERQGNLREAFAAVQTCLDLADEDADHLALAYRIYRQVGMTDKARDILAKLRNVNPYKADMLEND